jgi:hypothetical protein
LATTVADAEGILRAGDGWPRRHRSRRDHRHRSQGLA